MATKTVEKDIKKSLLMFKDKPLVRCGDTIYYGDVNDRFVIEMQVKNSHILNGIKISEKILVLMVDSDLSNNKNKKIIKMSEKDGLYSALCTAENWLNSAKEFQIAQN